MKKIILIFSTIIITLSGCVQKSNSNLYIEETIQNNQEKSDVEKDQIYQDVKNDLINENYEEAIKKVKDIEGYKDIDNISDEINCKWAKKLADNNQFDKSQNIIKNIKSKYYNKDASDYIVRKKTKYFMKQNKYYEAFKLVPDGTSDLKTIIQNSYEEIYNKIYNKLNTEENSDVELLDLSLKLYAAKPNEDTAELVKRIYLKYIPEKWYNEMTKELVCTLKHEQDNQFLIDIPNDISFLKKGSYQIDLIYDEVITVLNNDKSYLMIIGNDIFQFRTRFNFTTTFFSPSNTASLHEGESLKKDEVISLVSDPSFKKEYNNQEEKKDSSDITVPKIGMKASKVKQTSWGIPNKINKTTYEWGTTEQWVYSNNRYVYLKNGIVTSISDSIKP